MLPEPMKLPQLIMAGGGKKSDVRDLTLEERLRLKKDGFATAPKHDSESSDDDDDDDDEDEDAGEDVVEEYGEDHQPTTKRANKNRPREITSKRPVGRFREVLQVRKKTTRDPRFDHASGKLNEDLFKKSYAFLDDIKEAELQEAKKQLKHAKSKTRKTELQQDISSRKQELAEAKRADRIRDANLKRKREEREAVENGKGAFYLKRKDKKQLELKAKFDELQESGRFRVRGFRRPSSILPFAMGAVESTPAQAAISGLALWKAATASDGNKVRAITEHVDAAQVINWLSIVTLLVDRGAALDLREAGQGNSALHIAASKNKVSVLEKLISAGCDPHLFNKDGLTALDLARFRGHREATNVFARHLMQAKGWLYMKKGRSLFLSWSKRWCVIYECSQDHSRMELGLFHHPDDVKPSKVIFLTSSENAASPRASSRHRSKHSFSFTSTTTYQKYSGKETFSRSLDVRKARHIPVYNASGFRFATETVEGRDKWIQLLGPLAFSNNVVRGRQLQPAHEDEPVIEPTTEPTSWQDPRFSTTSSSSGFRQYDNNNHGSTSNNATPSAPPMEDSNMAKMDMNECVICMDMPRTAVCVPCGHLAGCYNCLLVVQKKSGCPICRSAIAAVVRVYTC
ncbi:hypothetical protein DYB38_006793 [Aphanomyces astaci]|uniref:RING-type domain-containing protein n=1 Tax=Aphanomyces astaci TaxID=112090 RepID=A0A397E094_APHAT|nr:hypothetical protein DYB34_008710 [Aphanomyces astaci]RHY71386.1 hypothetical protein DYB38_006793 [Aphanomyces astaci]